MMPPEGTDDDIWAFVWLPGRVAERAADDGCEVCLGAEAGGETGDATCDGRDCEKLIDAIRSRSLMSAAASSSWNCKNSCRAISSSRDVSFGFDVVNETSISARDALGCDRPLAELGALGVVSS
jgi:hypothetical protein